MEIQSAILAIKALCNKTTDKGCTEAEALSAAKKIGELLTVYNLSMDKIFLDGQKCITGKVETGRKRRHPIDSCLTGIARFCDCRVWFTQWPRVAYNFFGLEPDVGMAQYLYGIIYSAIENETEQFKQGEMYENAYTHRKRLSVSFQRGMAIRIHHRLEEMTRDRHREEKEKTPECFKSSGTDLVVVKHNKVENEFEALNLGLRKAASHARVSSRDAFYEGQAAGNRVNLNRPISGGVSGYLQ